MLSLICFVRIYKSVVMAPPTQHATSKTKFKTIKSLINISNYFKIQI